MEEPVGGVVEGPPERRPRALHEDLVERRGHALGAERPPDRYVDHGRQDRASRGLEDGPGSIRGSVPQTITLAPSNPHLAPRREVMTIATSSPLHRTVIETATDIWNDSCAVDELEYAIANGAVGATANPTIVSDVWKADPARWRATTRDLAGRQPGLDRGRPRLGDRRGDVARGRAPPPAGLRAVRRPPGPPVHADEPDVLADARPMLAQGVHFDGLAPNIIVKFPATSVGIGVMEEATYRGVSVNCTVSFSVAQAVAAAEAVERGLRRREADGLADRPDGPGHHDHDGPHRGLAARPGRARRDRRRPGGPAVVRCRGLQAGLRVFRERGLRARLLGAAIRHHLHWSELIGGDVVITLPSVWQKRFNASDVEVRPRMDDPVDPAIVDELRRHFPDFVRAYEPDGLTIDEFDTFPPTVRTLRAFIASYHELLHQVGEAVLPNPDVRS